MRHEEAGAFAAGAQAQLGGDPRRVHGHGRARARCTCSTVSTTPRSPTRRCWRSAVRCRSPSWAATSSRRSTTTRCSATCRCSAARSPAPRSCRACSSRRSSARWTPPASPCSPCPATSARSTPTGRRRASPTPRCPSFPSPAPSRRRPSGSTAPERVTLLVGHGARHARDRGAGARRPARARPMVLTLKAKEGLEADNPFAVGQSGLIGNPAAQRAFDALRPAADARHRLPLHRLVSEGQGGHPGRPPLRPHRTADGRRSRDRRRHARSPSPRCSQRVRRQDRPRAPGGRDRALPRLARAPAAPRRPRLRHARRRREGPGAFDNPDERIRPEAVAVAVDRHASSDAIFTSDTGMSTVWLSRFVTMRGDRRLHRLLQPRLDGQRDAPGARRPGAAPRPPGDRLLRRRRADHAARRPHHRGHPRAAGAPRGLQQRPPGDGQARAGAGAACPSSAPSCPTSTSPAIAHGRRAARRPRRATPTTLDDAIAAAFAHPGPVLARRGHQPRGDLAPAQDQAALRRGGSRSPS